MRYSFYKYHGLGNDFLLFDLRQTSKQDEHTKTLSSAARRLCDRRFGVGADGIFLLLPSEKCQTRVEIYNADGSRPEMCGNGIRCVARYLYTYDSRASQTLSIDTDAGVKECEIVLDEKNIASSVIVKMGAPTLLPAKIPFLSEDSRAISVPFEGFQMTAVSMGNPHAVIFDDFPASPLAAAKKWGPSFEVHQKFPNKTNVEFAKLLSSHLIELAVWERGCGITLACGTGACATAVAAVLTKRVSFGEEIEVRVPGGPLFITVEKDFSEVLMRGAAREVFFASLLLKSLEEAPSY